MWLLIVALWIVAAFVLAYHRSPIWLWASGLGAVGLLSMLLGGQTSVFAWILFLLPAMVLAVLSIPFIRMPLLTKPALDAVRKILPRVSRTEQEALDAGTVGWDAELFSGRPTWSKLMDMGPTRLTAEEQAFLDGPTVQLCEMIDDWDVRHNLFDLPPDVWHFIKTNKFFGMLISKEHGGLGFSAQAQSQIISRIASRAVVAGITVMVPNSLGPGELLEKYGTKEQKDKYLARLADGREVPCFALTGTHSGSDAAGMRDVGVVERGEYAGKEVLGIRLNFDKRYITLAPVATLLGLAFHLHDPQNLMGKGKDVGITLALIPHNHPGVEVGKRHFPSRSGFMNGPIRGEDVFIPLEFLIGGKEYAGQGWRMLMECLSTGRAISLPAMGSVSIKQALRTSSAYARVRRQFGIPVGLMEGVAEPLSRLVKNAYRFEAGRELTATMVDQGEKPSVISAVLKYSSTEAFREALDDAMDIHGGRGIQDGPSNYLFGAYMLVPVAVTVEGANILTRTLITFAQGVLRAHPYLYAEIQAAQNDDAKAALRAFDKAFGGHVAFMLANITGSFWQALTGGRFNASPVEHDLAPIYRKLGRYSQSFALMADWTAVILGGSLKAKQALSGRMADILTEIYILSAALKRFEDEGRIEEDVPLLEAIARDSFARIEGHMIDVLHNFPNKAISLIMGFLVLPLGAHARSARDEDNLDLVRKVLRPSGFRDRLTRGVYTTTDPKDPLGSVEDAFLRVTEVADIETKFLRALKKGEISRRLDRDAIADAVEKGILSDNEAGHLRAADEATERVVKVDEFGRTELKRKK